MSLVALFHRSIDKKYCFFVTPVSFLSCQCFSARVFEFGAGVKSKTLAKTTGIVQI